LQNLKVTEEAVLGDATGLHLGAGPYMLMYSRALDEEIEKSMEEPVLYEALAVRLNPFEQIAALLTLWYTLQKDIRERNATVLSQMPPDWAAKVFQPENHRKRLLEEAASTARRAPRGALNTQERMDVS
jgi:flagellar motor switch protein FliG